MEGSLTICTGNRCWRNGARRLVEAANEAANEARASDVVVRTVGCSGVCPPAAVSVCEGPDCAGEALALTATDETSAAASAKAAIRAVRHARA